MISSEDSTREMPINRDYDAKVTNEVFLPDTDIPNGETDPFEVDSATNFGESKDDMMDRNMANEVGSTGASDELTATLDMGAMKTKGIFRVHEEKVADMNVEGMPWFHDKIDEQELQMRRSVPELNRRETIRVIMSSLLAALMVASVFILGMFLFILFCTKIWF
ncbi:MAG: hypothetical protein PUC65_16150 [Clostridiales bacterium]|nr:hypothetical protein [Clostridiales bacterium]